MKNFENESGIDVESELYRFLDRAKKENVLDDIRDLARKSIFVFDKRFSFDECEEIPTEEELAEYVSDCVNGVIAADETGKFENIFKVFNNEDDQTMIMSIIYGLIIPAEEV